MSRLFENYVERMLLKNQELYEQARRDHDEYRQRSTVVTRVMREILHERVIWMEPDRDVLDLVDERLSQSMEEIAQLPVQVVAPALLDTPLFVDFGDAVIGIEQAQEVLPSIAGMMFQCPGDRSVMREALGRLPTKFHLIIQEVIGREQTTWTLSCLDELGEEVLVYLYSNTAPGSWTWQMNLHHQCPYKKCRYRSGLLIQSCNVCESIKALYTMQFGLLLLYDSGYFQDIVVLEQDEPRTYTINPAGKTLNESETTRDVKVRRIHKDVLRKEVGVSKPVVNPRGSWLAKHAPEEVETIWKKRRSYTYQTKSGNFVEVTPKQEKRIRRLKRTTPQRTVIELVASSKEEFPKLQEE